MSSVAFAPAPWCSHRIEFVPPNVQNWLRTPVVDVSGMTACAMAYDLQLFTPQTAGGENDYWVEKVIVDGGDPVLVAARWGDQCEEGYDPCHHFHVSEDLTHLLPANTMCYEWVYYSTDDGAGPDICNCAGLTIDSAGLVDSEATAVEGTSWGRVKSLYR